jgi:hypothetical protein
MLGGKPDETQHPKGKRTQPDDILNVLHLYKLKGAELSPFSGGECSRIQKMSPAPFEMANSDEKGATVEFPFPGGWPPTTMMRILTDVKHPKLGSGALLLLTIPGTPDVDQDPRLANALNVAELYDWSRTRSFGAWYMDTEKRDSPSIAYVSFLPAMTKMNGLLENEVLQMATRTKWLHEHFGIQDRPEVPVRRNQWGGIHVGKSADSDGSGFGCRPVGLPAVREQVVELGMWVGADAREQVAKIGERLDVQALASGDQTGQDGAGSTARITAVEEPVVATHHNVAETALGAVVVDFQVAVFAVTQQRLPVFQGVLHGFADGAFG